jgi:opacity protein-like surface antigen
MRQHRSTILAAAIAAWLLPAATASADITAFLGWSGGPAVRSGWGAAAGLSFVVVGLEFEYADAHESIADGAPRIRTGNLNLLLQTPMAVGGVQIYGTAGAGGYHQDLGTLSETNTTVNLGGGVKINVAGPLRIRVDYRFFRFLGAPIGGENVHRFYVGGNLKF